MSTSLIDHSEDLQELVEYGYEVAVRCDHLILSHIPYVTPEKKIKFGKLVAVLAENGGRTLRPPDHTLYFVGETPCNAEGQPLKAIINNSNGADLGGGLKADHYLSARPKDLGNYRDYFHKMHTYADMISRHACVLDSTVTARTYVQVQSDEEDAIFKYRDTASTRAGILAVSQKLELPKVGIVGLGGTGSYVLDLISKTRVREIHLFDGDLFEQHNAFRSPGAPSVDTLRQRMKKVDYFAELYAPMRNNIVPHAEFLTADNLKDVEGMDFVFLCIDVPDAKSVILEKLEADGTPFVDVGMGVRMIDDCLSGTLRTITSTTNKRDHYRKRVNLASVKADNEDDAYAQNIQIADLNALHAAFAVVKWKKMLGFYTDLEMEHSSFYAISDNKIINEDQP